MVLHIDPRAGSSVYHLVPIYLHCGLQLVVAFVLYYKLVVIVLNLVTSPSCSVTVNKLLNCNYTYWYTVILQLCVQKYQ